MKKNGHITAFYLETLLLIVVFIGIILVLTQVFGLSRTQSREAKRLTNSVTLAANAAEAFSAAEEPAELLAFLNENGNAAALPDTLGVTARYDADMRPDPAGELRVDVCCTVEENSLVQGHIQVFRQGAEAPVYELETAALWKEVSP